MNKLTLALMYFLVSAGSVFFCTLTQASNSELLLTCSSDTNESRTFAFPPGIRSREMDRIRRDFSHQSLPLQQFASGAELRTRYASPEIRALGEILIASSLQRQGSTTVALTLWKRLLSNSELPRTLRIHALECMAPLTELHSLYSIEESDPVIQFVADSYSDLSESTRRKLTSWLIAHPSLIARLKLDSPFRSAEEALISFVQRQDRKDLPGALSAAESFFEITQNSTELNPFSDWLALQSGRIAYGEKRDELAEKLLRKVSARSNHKIDALEALQWTYLRSGKIRDALGIGISLQSAAYSQAWTSESRSLQAIAYQEYCHYPEAAKSLESASHWIDEQIKSVAYWENSSTLLDSLLELSKERKGEGHPPIQERLRRSLAQDLVRRENTLQAQLEIIHLKREKKNWDNLIEKSQNDLRSLIREFQLKKAQLETVLAQSQFSREKIRELKPELLNLKSQIRDLKRIQRASRLFDRLTSLEQGLRSGKNLQKIQDQLTRQIRLQLQATRMVLEETRDNLDRVGIAIHRSASRDVIWKNAHPQFANWIEKHKSKLESPDSGEPSSYHWGKIAVAATPDGGNLSQEEIWEDETDALKADIPNLCSGKRSFLKLGSRNSNSTQGQSSR